MTFIRGTFLFALITLFAGAAGGHYVASSLFSDDGPATTDASIVATSTPVPAATATAVPRPQKAATAPQHTPTPRPASTPTVTATPIMTATSLPTATASPTAGGQVALTSYSVGSPVARPGQTIALGYVIDNPTGHELHVALGASLKSSLVSWTAGAMADPSHDVVATVPPGLSRHIRFFTLSARLKAGTYDVAWGLRDTTTGQRVGLAVSAGGLTIRP